MLTKRSMPWRTALNLFFGGRYYEKEVGELFYKLADDF